MLFTEGSNKLDEKSFRKSALSNQHSPIWNILLHYPYKYGLVVGSLENVSAGDVGVIALQRLEVAGGLDRKRHTSGFFAIARGT